jgi:type II secretory pathway pseudopilin PulG
MEIYRRGGNMAKLLYQERGFTIIEAIVAQVILIVGAVAIWSVFIMGTRLNAEAEDRTIAANIAQLKMEEIMNTRFRYIVYDHPAGETTFESEPQGRPYWTLDSQGEWTPALPDGKYEVSYPGPDGEDSDPLRIRVKISWRSHLYADSSLALDTLVSMTPGRFEG